MKKAITILLTLISGFGLIAQTKIAGVIKDSNGQLLTGANIYLDGTYDGTTSDANGNFSFTTHETGKQHLKINFIGFEPFTKELDLTGKTITLTIVLHEAFNELEAVNITAGTFEAGDKKKSIAITSLDMVTTPSATGNIYGALETLPGTTTVGESGKLFVKGGDSNESKTYIDGTLVYVPYTSSAPNTSVRGRFDPFMFSGTMFSTGGYSAEYGQALSSILELKTNEMAVEDQLNISLLTVGGSLAGTKSWDKSSLTVSTSYNNLKPYMLLVPQNREWGKEPESFSGAVTYRQKTAKSGLFKFYGSLNRSDLILNNPNNGDMGTTSAYHLVNNNAFVNLSWNGEFKNQWILSTGFSFTHNIDYTSMDSSDYNKFLNGAHAKVVIAKKLNNKIKLRAGSELFSKKFNMEYLAINDSILEGFQNNTIAGFTEAEIYTSSKFVCRIGARVEGSSYLNKGNFAPRLSTAYKFSKFSQMSLSYGWFLQDPADDILLYANNLNYERADHYIMDFQFEKSDRVLRSEFYYKQYNNLVKFNPSTFYDAESYNNSGNGYAYGFDLFWRDNKTIKNGEYWISYSYIDTRRNYRDYPELAIPNYTSRHNLSLVYKYWIAGLRSMVGVSYKLASPRYYNNPNVPEFNSEKTIPYQTLDLNWSFLYRQNIVVYASVSNVPGFKQQFGYSYSSTPDSQGIYDKTAIVPGAKRFFLLACFITLSRKGDLNQMDKIN